MRRPEEPRRPLGRTAEAVVAERAVERGEMRPVMPERVVDLGDSTARVGQAR